MTKTTVTKSSASKTKSVKVAKPKQPIKRTTKGSPAVVMLDPAASVSPAPSRRRASTIEAKAPRRLTNSAPQLSHETISLRAWEIWQREGCPNGRDLEHWLLAERELSGE